MEKYPLVKYRVLNRQVSQPTKFQGFVERTKRRLIRLMWYTVAVLVVFGIGFGYATFKRVDIQVSTNNEVVVEKAVKIEEVKKHVSLIDHLNKL